jgi:thiamine-phosphate pyrophosphorylase
MPLSSKLKGVYVITDDTLTPDETLFSQVEDALKGGATIVQLRDKKNDEETIEKKAIALQELCHEYNAMFVLNDKVELAIKLQCDGLHIGKSDHARFDEIRKDFKGCIGVSCYGDVDHAKEFEQKGADYVAFGSFFTSPTKPNSNIVPLEVISEAKEKLTIPVCAIGGINKENVDQVVQKDPEMISLISDIWNSDDITAKTLMFATKFK